MTQTSATHWNVDLLVIGWGKGGKTLAGARGRAGDRVVLVEQSAQMYGGTCINVACVPTKALVHRAAQRRDGDDESRWYADTIGRVDTLTSAMRAKNYDLLDEVDTVTTVTGRARFTGERTAEVSAGEERLAITADTVVINTGSVPVVPPIEGLADSPRMVTNAELLSTQDLPGRLVVIGGGPIGLEFAAAYRRLGRRSPSSRGPTSCSAARTSGCARAWWTCSPRTGCRSGPGPGPRPSVTGRTPAP